ncbi:hypothetical protein, partial [Actinoplanes sp. NPDC049265]|uniref:hypothetical protein n=1 Tax=Actinoplanes sp. NPDC049265 TaxID=3363902 RepID=UPI0037207DCD
TISDVITHSAHPADSQVRRIGPETPFRVQPRRTQCAPAAVVTLRLGLGCRVAAAVINGWLLLWLGVFVAVVALCLGPVCRAAAAVINAWPLPWLGVFVAVVAPRLGPDRRAAGAAITVQPAA